MLAGPALPDVAEMRQRLARAIADAGDGALASSGIGLTVLAVLAMLALIPPLMRGWLMPASAYWRPMHFVRPLDPPG